MSDAQFLKTMKVEPYEPADPNRFDLETENLVLRSQWQYVCAELQNRSAMLSDAIQQRNAARASARRSQRAFQRASLVAAVATIAAWAGWLR
jgi:hypothetical protein